MMVRARVVLAVVVCAGVGTPSAWAQIASGGSIRGYVKDQQGAVLPGVTLTATSPTVAGTFTTASDEEGHYRLINLPPGEYTLRADLQGFAGYAREGILVRAGLNLSVDITMQIGSVTETVEVKLDTPILETMSATQGVRIAGQFQRDLPTSSRRDWADVLSLAPSVVTLPGSAISTYYSRGAEAGSQVIQIDGADVGSAQTGGTNYVSLSTDAIADVHIKTAGHDASTPLGQGAIISIASPSGTDRLRASGTVVFRPDIWTDRNNPGGTTPTERLFQLDFSSGGPIVKGDWWFFGAHRYMRRFSSLARSPTQVESLRTIAPAFTPFDLKNEANFSFLKTTLRLGDAHTLSGFAQFDLNPRDSAQPQDAEPFSNTTNGGAAYSAKLESTWSVHTTTQLLVAYNDKAFQVEVTDPSRQAQRIYRDLFLTGGRLVGSDLLAALGNTQSGFDQTYTKLTIGADAVSFRGAHEWRAGLYFQPRLIEDTRELFVNGGATLQEYVLRDPGDLRSSYRLFHARTYETDSRTIQRSSTADYALYVEDRWRMRPFLTLMAGLRADVIRRHDRLFDVPLQRVVALGPRLGMSMAWSGDRNVVNVGFGRVHEGVQVGRASAGTNTAAFTDGYDYDGDGIFESQFRTSPVTAVSSNRVIDAKRAQPFVDELTGTYHRRLRSLTSVGVGFVRRSFRRRSALIEVNGIYDDDTFRGYKDVDLTEVYLHTANTWNWPVYSDVFVELETRTQNARLLASYTRQWRHIAGTWQPNDAGSIIQPDTFANTRGIGSVGGSVTSPSEANSLSGSSMVGAPQWRDHVARVAGSYSRSGFHVGAAYSYQSGPWSGPIVTRIAAPDPRFGPASLRLANGRLVANPLATTIRFAFDHRGTGQFRPKAFQDLNLRVSRTWTAGLSRLEAGLDVFNLLNYDADLAVLFGGNQLFSPNFGGATGRQLPRAAAAFARIAF